MGKNLTILALLNASTPIQLARVRAHLEHQESQWCTEYTPQEHSLALRALEAFDAKEYADEVIARYMTPSVIEKIFG